MDEECGPLNRLHQLDYIAIQTQAQEIGEIISEYVDTPFKYEQLRSPQLYSVLVRPIVDKIRKEFLNGGVFYCLLANRIHFHKEEAEDLANSKLWRTRSMICEVISVKLLNEFKIDVIAQNFAFEFYPLSDGKSSTTGAPSFLRVSAFELAIYSEAKMLLSHPLIVSIIQELWEGTLIYDPLIYKAHRMGLSSHAELNSLIQTNRGLLVRYDLESDTKFKLSRLRVPKYRHALKLVSVLVLVALYASNLQDFDQEWTLKEYFFIIWSSAFAIDEFVSLKKVGTSLYFKTLWAPFDFTNAVVLMTYTVLRVFAKLKDSAELNAWAYQVLALAGVLLIPRCFAFLDGSQEFSSMMISGRKILIDLVSFWIVIAIFSLGFWASLSKFADGIFSPAQVLNDQVQILFGFTPAVWNTWREYTSLGRFVLFAYLFVVQFVVTTMVIAALSARYSEIIARADEEYHYVQTIQTITKLKSEKSQLFFFAEPFNLMGFLLYPTKYVLSMRQYILLNRLFMRVTQMPILLCIYVYEKTLWRLESRKKRAEALQAQQLKQHLKHARESAKRSSSHSRAAPNSANNLLKRKKLFERSLERTSKMDLVAGALETQLPSEPSSSTGTVRRDSSSGAGFGSVRFGNAFAAGGNHNSNVFRHPGGHNVEDVFGDDQHHPVSFQRSRSYSTTSSVLQNLNTFKLSPGGTYPIMQRVKDDEEASEVDGLYDFLQEMSQRNKNIEGMLEAMLKKADKV